jgi:hypothetical protein
LRPSPSWRDIHACGAGRFLSGALKPLVYTVVISHLVTSVINKTADGLRLFRQSEPFKALE